MPAPATGAARRRSSRAVAAALNAARLERTLTRAPTQQTFVAQMIAGVLECRLT
jgi:hypothetical protein